VTNYQYDILTALTSGNKEQFKQLLDLQAKIEDNTIALLDIENALNKLNQTIAQIVCTLQEIKQQ
jgi:predicted  nucleic acid-binding Zn-ribbon protein